MAGGLQINPVLGVLGPAPCLLFTDEEFASRNGDILLFHLLQGESLDLLWGW